MVALGTNIHHSNNVDVIHLNCVTMNNAT